MLKWQRIRNIEFYYEHIKCSVHMGRRESYRRIHTSSYIFIFRC